MLARLMVAVRGSGLGVRASGEGLVRVAGAGCPGLRQQREASTAEVSGAWWLVAECRTAACRRSEGGPPPKAARSHFWNMRRMKYCVFLYLVKTHVYIIFDKKQKQNTV